MPFIDEQKPVVDDITNLVPNQEQLTREQSYRDGQQFKDMFYLSILLIVIVVILTGAWALRKRLQN